jgi:hypothetical protein
MVQGTKLRLGLDTVLGRRLDRLGSDRRSAGRWRFPDRGRYPLSRKTISRTFRSRPFAAGVARCAFFRPEIGADLRDIRRDRFDLRRDRRELRRDLRLGNLAAIARGRADIQADRMDIQRDFRDLRRDFRGW